MPLATIWGGMGFLTGEPAWAHCEFLQIPPYLGVGLCELRSRLLFRWIA
jgi:hypothetical protein